MTLSMNSVPNRDEVVSVHATLEPWVSLLAAGFIESDGSEASSETIGVRFTSAGLRALNTCIVHSDFRFVFQVRHDLPIPELTEFEMASLLCERGWDWTLMPRQIKNRQSLSHDTHCFTGCVYSLGRTLVK